jgi:hypothetical protein
MTPEDFKHARGICGRSTRQWGLALGYGGKHVTLQVRQMESGAKPIPASVARLAWLFWRHGVPEGWDEGHAPAPFPSAPLLRDRKPQGRPSGT